MWLCWRPALSLREPPPSHHPSSLKVLSGSRSASLNAPGCFRWASFPLLSFQGFGQEGSLNKFACSSLCQFGGFGQFFGFDQSGVNGGFGRWLRALSWSCAASPVLPLQPSLPQGNCKTPLRRLDKCRAIAVIPRNAVGLLSWVSGVSVSELYGQIRSWLSKA